VPRFAHIRVLAHSASASNVPRRRYWIPYTSRGMIWSDPAFVDQRIVLKYDICTKNRPCVLEGPEMRNSCLYSSAWKFSTGRFSSVSRHRLQERPSGSRSRPSIVVAIPTRLTAATMSVKNNMFRSIGPYSSNRALFFRCWRNTIHK
jgi:hypothetical protein